MARSLSTETATKQPEQLESGASLSEREHDGELAPRDWAIQYRDVPASRGTIESLRAEIAGDLLATGPTAFTFTSPFDVPHKNLQVPLVFCDQTASNRTVQSIENYVQTTCLPLYGNTHTNTTITGAQSNAFVAEARQIVAEETNARITGKASLDVVLFAGNGTTAAVELLIDCLGLKHASNPKPVVFVGPHEHHSNILPWRETGCETVPVPESPTGTVDVQALERLLQDPSYRNRLSMGTFTAASNVNGRVADVDAIAATLHRHGALAFFDYATAAPYMSMDMNPSPSHQYPQASLIAKDAIFLSPHKMLGGVGTPGVLIVKKHLVDQRNAPGRSGGGTVFYVSNTHHRFLSNRIHRYEGGTPNVSGIFRVGLTFLLKRQVEQKYQLLLQHSTNSRSDQFQENPRQQKEAEPLPPTLQRLEFQTHIRVAQYLRQHAPNLILLDGDNSTNTNNREDAPHHLPIFSFLIKCGKRFLHYNYVCAVLNDVFGIQSRGGCQCAGPYSQRLLGLTKATDGKDVPNEQNQAIEHALLHYKERAELLRPGYTRLSLPFKGLRSEEAEYVMKALVWTAKNGWALICNYRCNHRTGEWRHANRQGRPLGSQRKWLTHYDHSFRETVENTNSPGKESLASLLDRAFANADCILEFARSDQKSILQALKMNDAQDADELEELRWYMYPKECAVFLSQGLNEVPCTDSSDIVGGLKPLACSLAGSLACPSCDDVIINTVLVREKKRKLDESAMPNRDAPGQRLESEQYYFRDGEHSGEAGFSELEVGFNDEELSDKCEVLDKCSGEWQPIEAFLQGHTKSTATKPSNVAQKPSNVHHPNDKDMNGKLEKDDELKKPAWGLESGEQGQSLQAKGEEVKQASRDIDESALPNGFAPEHLSGSEMFFFRDGKHSGEAIYSELEMGFNDEELSDKCEVFDQGSGEWLSIEAFLHMKSTVTKTANVAQKSPDAAWGIDSGGHGKSLQPKGEEVKQAPGDMDKTAMQSGVASEQLSESKVFFFRDGEHSGEAVYSELEMGFDDEELSDKCEVFDQKSGEWLSIEVFLRGCMESATNKTTKGAQISPDANHPEDKNVHGGLDKKNERKKPARGLELWGKGKFVEPKLGPTCSDGKNWNASAHVSAGQNEPVTGRKAKHKHVTPPAKLMRCLTQAIVQWNMLEEGDRLLLGLSGGKDSLSLLHCLLECKRKMPINFDIEVCTIDPMTPSFDPSPLIPYVEALGLKYHYIRDDIVARANSAGKHGKIVSSLCAFCARMKRGNLYTCARKNNCNKLVLAQHLDDCAESFLMSVMHNGFLRTMKAHYKIDAGDMAVIRPLIYCRESLMTNFAKSANLPVINENCPACFEEPKERARIKKLLSREETLYPHFYDNIRRSLIPLMHDDLSGILRGYTEEAVRKSRKEPFRGEKKNQDTGSAIGQNGVCGGSKPSESAQDAAAQMKHISSATEEELLMELARRKADRLLRTAASHSDADLTGQICTLRGGNGSIPCKELME